MKTTYEMKSKGFVKVRLNKGDKIFTLTQQTFKTKTDGESKLGNSGRYAIMNKKALLNLIDQGWLDSEIEKQINEYTKQKAERDIVKYANKKHSEQVVNDFLNTPNYNKVNHNKFNGYGVQM